MNEYRHLSPQPDFLLTSMPHSGTQFFQELIQPRRTYHVTGGSILTFCNTASIIACAVRNPRDVMTSWWHRGKLFKRGSTELSPQWTKGWETLRYVLGHFPVFILPIDHPTREKQLGFLEKRTGDYYLPNWNRCVGARKTEQPGPVPKVDLSPAFSIPVIHDLYSEAA